MTRKRSATATVELRLATPEALAWCLAFLGIRWQPVPLARIAAGVSGLYVWVAASGVRRPSVTHGVLYVGVGQGADGVAGRLRREWSWVGPGAAHGHGRAMRRLRGAPLGGRIDRCPMGGRLADHIPAEAAVRAEAWLAGLPPAALVEAAEKIAIRVALHVGDSAPPVNCAGTSAWAVETIADWAAIAAARALGEDWGGEEVAA